MGDVAVGPFFLPSLVEYKGNEELSMAGSHKDDSVTPPYRDAGRESLGTTPDPLGITPSPPTSMVSMTLGPVHGLHS